MAMGEAEIGGGMRVSSNSLIFSFKQVFYSSILAIETSNASSVTL
jgi:hypothetical protein